MSLYVDNPNWATNIYLLETTDSVIGGPSGISNQATKEIADRTALIKNELEKQGIYLNDSPATKFEGVNTINDVTFDAAVVTGDVVYYNAGDTKFYQAISDGTDKDEVVGIADVENLKVITSGIIKTSYTFTPSENLYLSGTTLGVIENTISNVYIGKYLYDGLISLGGIGSGLDADKLDGLDSSAFARINGDNTKTFKVSDAINGDEAVSKAQLDLKATLAEAQAYDLGVGQTWQNVTASRSAGVTYTNTTGKPIMVFLGTGETRSSTVGYNSSAVIYVDNIIVASATNNNLNVASGGVPVSSAQTIVPSGSTYKFDWEVGYDDGVLLITELR